jgi:anti-sigma B factor antagonist
MFEITVVDPATIRFSGRLDANQVQRVREALDKVSGNVTVDFSELQYISSAGLGVLLAAQKRLSAAGCTIRIVRMNNHIRDIFKIAGFDFIFDIA